MQTNYRERREMKKYFIFGLILIGLITLFVYIENNSFTSFAVMGVDVSLPNAVWVGIFLSFFFIFSLMFLGYIDLKNKIYQKNIKKDTKTILENFKNKILHINTAKNVKLLKEINVFSENIKGLSIVPKQTKGFEYLEDLKKLKSGEVIDIGKYKLKEDNPWFIMNVKNRLKKEPSYAKEVLKKFKNEELKKTAFYMYAKSAKIDEILKYPYDITFEIVKAHINDEQLSALLKKAKLKPKEEIETAKIIYGTKTPDIELDILKPLKWGRAYLAIKYSHFDLAKEIVESNNLKFFEYYLKLPKKDDIDEYISSQIC